MNKNFFSFIFLFNYINNLSNIIWVKLDCLLNKFAMIILDTSFLILQSYLFPFQK